MSHVGNGEHDFEDLSWTNLTTLEREFVKGARIKAREIIDTLEPRHISGWAELQQRLETALVEVRTARWRTRTI